MWWDMLRRFFKPDLPAPPPVPERPHDPELHRLRNRQAAIWGRLQLEDHERAHLRADARLDQWLEEQDAHG